jgi:hypothetical protein
VGAEVGEPNLQRGTMTGRTTSLTVRTKRRGTRLLGLLGVGLMLSGCWPQIGYGPDHRRQNPDETAITAGTVASLRQAWAVDVATDDEPIVSGGRVFVGYDTTSTFGVQATGVATGSTLWNRTIARIDPAFTAELQPVTTATGQVWASYSAARRDGQQCGAAQVRLEPADGAGDPGNREGGVLGHPPVEAGGAVVQVRTLFPDSPDCGREITTLNVTPSSGPAWSYRPPGGQIPGLPSVRGERIFVPVGNELLTLPLNGCGAATCAPTWTIDLGAPVRDVVIGGGEAFALTSDPASGQARLTAVRFDGSVSWTATVGASDGRLAHAGDRVYVVASGTGERADTLQAFAGTGCGRPTCAPVWSAQLGGAGSATGAVIAGDRTSEVVLVGRDGNPQGMSVSDAHLLVTTGSRLLAFTPAQPG